MEPQGSLTDSRVVVIGAGGHASVAIDILRLSGFTTIGIIDDNPLLHGELVEGVPIVGNNTSLAAIRAAGVTGAFIAVGNNASRIRLADHVAGFQFELVNAIHPTSVIASSVHMGNGILVAANAVVNPRARIDDLCIINTGATVDHDCIIGRGAHLAPGCHLAGSVFVGSETHIGIGASIIQNVSVGDDVMIGAGAVVLRDIPNGRTAYGIPARCV